MNDLPKQLRIKAGMISMGERIAWGSDSAIMEKAADLIEQLQQRITELEVQRNRELNKIESELQGAFSRIDQLVATVERLREYIERGSPYSTNPSKCERKAILAATSQQKPNAVKREAS